MCGAAGAGAAAGATRRARRRRRSGMRGHGDEFMDMNIGVEPDWGDPVNGLDAVRGLWAVPTTYRREVAEDLAAAGKKVAVKQGQRRPGDPPSLVAAAARAARELAWQPSYTELRPIVETAWNWHRKHPRGYADR